MEKKIRELISEYRQKIIFMQETIDRLEKIVDDDYEYEPEVKEHDELM